MANNIKITTEAGKPEVVIEVEFDYPRELIFQAYTNPELYKSWHGPRDLEMTLVQFEPHDGGSYKFVHTDKNGKEHIFHGVYHEVSYPERIIDTFEYEGLPEKGHVILETLKFIDLGNNRSKIISQSLYQSVEDRDGMINSGMEKGVNESFERMEELLKDIMNRNELVITREFNATKEKVFEVWTQPKFIKKWWGPMGYSAPIVKINLKNGGDYLYSMKGPDGNLNWSGGEFHIVDSPNSITLTDYFADKKGNKIDPSIYGLDSNFPKESNVTIKFEDNDCKTKLIIIYKLPESKEGRIAIIKNRMEEGWNSSLDKFQKLVEK